MRVARSPGREFRRQQDKPFVPFLCLFVAKILCASLWLSCEVALAQNQSINELRRMFDYDQNAPIDIREAGVITRNGVRIHDITYASPKDGRVTAYLVVPAVRGRFAGVSSAA